MRILTTPELTVGMIVCAHGSRFRLTECHFDAEKALRRAESAKGGALQFHPNEPAIAEEAFAREVTTRAFRTEYLGPEAGRYEAIPASWIANWTIQGNHRARWAVEA